MKHIFFYLLLTIGFTATAETKLPGFFANGMVLQQHSETFIWGMDDPGTTVKIVASWNQSASAKADQNGKWKVKIATPTAGGPYTIKISGTTKVNLEDVLIGEVWFCSGQSNMEMKLSGFVNQPIENANEEIANSANPSIRVFTAEKKISLAPQDEVVGNWQEASVANSGSFSAVAYYYGKRLQQILKVPVGLIVSSWGGSTIEAWMDLPTTSKFPKIVNPTQLPTATINRVPTLLYNGMVNPFIGYTIKGCIWYQGEQNVKEPEAYQPYFNAMINSWRKNWNIGDFPFYFVQIAPYNYGTDNASFLREAQLKTMLATANTGMAVTLDLGDCKGIHPMRKQQVGDRLAYWSISKTYQMKGLEASGPVFKSVLKKQGNQMVLAFDYTAMGMVNKADEANEFQIAGADKVFYPAKILINKDKTITVWNDNIKEPQAVRYGFTNCSKGTLFNTAGLPASSFRTDNW